jgi:hypothetical protein
VSREEVQDHCQLGMAAGKNEVLNLWKNPPFNSNCDNAWDLPAAADELKYDEFPDATGGSWQTVAYNQCARDYGVDPEVDKILEQCVDDDSTQCISLGETAASIIVYAKVCTGFSSAKHQDYLQTCREVAYGICMGAIDEKIEQQCPDEQSSVTTSDISSLMDMCEEQVNSMTDGEDKIVTKTPTRKPTKNPTKKPTKKPTKNPTMNPTRRPTRRPTTRNPTKKPTRKPTRRPTKRPTRRPTRRPTKKPTKRPKRKPTRKPNN